MIPSSPTLQAETKADLSSVESRLRKGLQMRSSTLLAIGPMSKNCVDAVIELAYEHPTPLTLIASRRQVDAAELGGGYVNNWSTELFSEYVRKHDPDRKVIIARDHGGPWQSTVEVAKRMTLSEAMASAKRSYEIDIQSGFDIIHLDPSIDINNSNIPQAVIIERLFELYDHCMQISQKIGRKILFEIGTEEQSGQQQSVDEVRSFLEKVEQFCTSRKYPKPFFVVVQTGTKVKETRNVGILATSSQDRRMTSPEVDILKLVQVCREFGIHMKEHNTDYLSDEILQWHPNAGIHAANVAPEFGVIETRQLLRLFDEFYLNQEKEKFLELAYDSRKWEKWLIKDSLATDYYKAVIAGHYIFSHPAFWVLKNQLAERCSVNGFELDTVLRHAIKHAIRRYMLAFNILV